MITQAAFLHYGSLAIAFSLAALGGGLGQGLAGFSVIRALQRQPLSHLANFRAMIIGLALIESGIIISLVMSLLLLFGMPFEITPTIAFAEIGIGCAVGISACASSIASSFVVSSAAQAIARQPFFANKIITFMLLMQSIIEAPVVFAFIIALLIRNNLSEAMPMLASLKNFAAGLIVGLGSIGPCIGQALFTQAACTGIGLNKDSYAKMFSFALLNAALIETPLIFCLLFAFMLLFSTTGIPATYADEIMRATALLASTCSMGLGSIGTPIGIGYAASRVCYQIARDPMNYSLLLRSNLLVIAFVESSIIYALIIALLLFNKAG